MADIFYPDETYGEALVRRTAGAAETRRILASLSIDCAALKPVAETVAMFCVSVALGAFAATFIPL